MLEKKEFDLELFIEKFIKKEGQESIYIADQKNGMFYIIQRGKQFGDKYRHSRNFLVNENYQLLWQSIGRITRSERNHLKEEFDFHVHLN